MCVNDARSHIAYSHLPYQAMIDYNSSKQRNTIVTVCVLIGNNSTKVRGNLPSYMQTHLKEMAKTALTTNGGVDLEKLQPLAIQETCNDQRSYKEMWCKGNAACSLETTQLYEAGGSAFWVCTGLFSDLELPVESLSWGQMEDVAGTFFGGGAETSTGRIIFPTVLDCFVLQGNLTATGGPKQFQSSYPHALQLITGHQLVHALYYALYFALQASDHQRVQKLVVCALTATIRLRLLQSREDAAKLSMDASASYVVKKEFLSDTWIGWLHKFRLVTVNMGSTWTQEMKYLTSNGITYERKAVSASLLGVTSKALPLFTPGSAVVELSDQIGREFGRDVFGSGYTKIHRMLLQAQKYIGTLAKSPSSKLDLGQTMHWLLECALVTLRRRQYTPAFFTVASLSSDRDKPGWCDLQLAKLTVLMHCKSYCGPLTGDRKAELDKVRASVALDVVIINLMFFCWGGVVCAQALSADFGLHMFWVCCLSKGVRGLCMPS